MNLLHRTGVYCHHNAGRLICSALSTPPASISRRQISTSEWKKYLNILNVTKDSSTKDIKNSFLKLSKVYHPDNKLTGSHTKFVELKQAYDALKDGHPRTTTSQSNSYYESDLSHESLRRYRERYKDFTNNHQYGFGGPYRYSKNPWEDLRKEQQYRKNKQYADNFGQKGRPIVSLTIVLSAVAWMVIYSSVLLIFDHNDKIKSGMALYKARSHEDYVAYQEYLKRKEAERILNIKQLKKMVEDQRKEEIPNDAAEVVKAL